MTPLEQVAAEGFRRLKRTEYDALVHAGAFEDERVELLYGVIVPMAPQDPAHSEPVTLVHEALMIALLGRARVRVQCPFAASDDSEPEPDVAVVAPRSYRDEHPSSAWLIVEVANSSHKRDRLKADLYAAANIPEYWLVDVPRRVVEVRTSPEGGLYTGLRTARLGESITLVAFPDVSLPVSDILGP